MALQNTTILLNNNTMTNSIIDKIQKENKILLSSRERNYIIKQVENIDSNMYKIYSLDNIINTLVKIFTGEIKKKRLLSTNINSKIPKSPSIIKKFNDENAMNKLQQSIINEVGDNPPSYLDEANVEQSDIITAEIESILGLKSEYKIQTLFNPEATLIRNYIVLDSKYRIIDNTAGASNITSFKWSYTDNINLQVGSVNTVGNIKNIKSIRVYQPRVPFVQSYMVTESRRINMLIHEFQAQSFLDYSGRKFHFDFQIILPFNTDPYPNMVELFVEDFGDGEFKFRKPITTFDTLTISFGNFANIVPFNYDSDTITFTYGTTTTLTTSQPHLFSTGVTTYVTITGFTTANPTVDASIISTINSLYEQAATITGSNTMTISVDTSTITALTGLTASIYFEERRIVIPLEFTYYKGE